MCCDVLHLHVSFQYGKLPVRLLLRAGYKGGGLGRLEQGITRPIQAKQRAARVGLGYRKTPATGTHTSSDNNNNNTASSTSTATSTSTSTSTASRPSFGDRLRARHAHLSSSSTVQRLHHQREREERYIQAAAHADNAAYMEATQQAEHAIGTVYDDVRTDPRREWKHRETAAKRARIMGSFALSST